VIADKKEPQAITDELIARARAAGGVDNVTVLVARLPAQAGGVKGMVSRLFGR